MTPVNYVDLKDAMDHIVAIEKLIMTDMATLLSDPSLDTQDAQGFMRYESAGYPKWLNEMTQGVSEHGGVYEEYETYTVAIELQLGKRTEGYDGQLEMTKWVWTPYVLAYFRTLPHLKSATLPTQPRGVQHAEIRIASGKMPGDIIACYFSLTLYTSVSNEERDF